MKIRFLRAVPCFILTLILIMPTANSQAQTLTACAGENTLAVFFDNGDINSFPAPYQVINMHFAIVNPTMPIISGLEFRLVPPSESSYIHLSDTFSGDSINVGTYPEYVVGFASPVPIINNQALIMKKLRDIMRI